MKKAIIASVAAFAIVGSSYFAINQFLNMGMGMDKIIATPIVNDSSKVSDKYKVRVETKPTKNINIKEETKIIDEASTVGIQVSSEELKNVQEKVNIPYKNEVDVNKENWDKQVGNSNVKEISPNDENIESQRNSK
ncbi:MAG: hypothetical protein ACRCWM_10565 [Sarcina sp.]